MGGSFQLLEHPSDIGFLARGGSREEALAEASRALTTIMVDPSAIQLREERAVYVSGGDPASQVVNWLNEILFLFDAEGLALGEFTIEAWNDAGIQGRVYGERLDPERHELRTAVKAVTYHQFDLRQTPEGWELRVFVDI